MLESLGKVCYNGTPVREGLMLIVGAEMGLNVVILLSGANGVVFLKSEKAENPCKS